MESGAASGSLDPFLGDRGLGHFLALCLATIGLGKGEPTLQVLR